MINVIIESEIFDGFFSENVLIDVESTGPVLVTWNHQMAIFLFYYMDFCSLMVQRTWVSLHCLET